jgi:hypothetical protein
MLTIVQTVKSWGVGERKVYRRCIVWAGCDAGVGEAVSIADYRGLRTYESGFIETRYFNVPHFVDCVEVFEKAMPKHSVGNIVC